MTLPVTENKDNLEIVEDSTVAVEQDVAAGGAPDTVGGTPAPAPAVAARVVKPVSPLVAVYGAALSILAALLLGFVADLTVVGAIHHTRDQRVAYADLRNELAHGTAPLGPVDYLGKPLPMGAPVALLAIPAIGVDEVVLEGTTSGVLQSGVGHARSSVLPGQVGTSYLLGRRAAYGGPFRYLASLRAGDPITVTTAQAVTRYVVRDVRRAGDPVPPALDASGSRLTLMTAAGGAYQPNGLLRVDADLQQGQQAQAAPFVAASLISALSQAEAPLNGDSSVLMVLVLWGQALLLAAVAVAWARLRWGRWQAWIVGVPLLSTLGLIVADRAAQLLPNLM